MRGHTDVVREAAIFKDGRRAVTGSDDRTLQIWDVQKGVLVAGPFEGHTRMSSRAIGVFYKQENACLESSIHQLPRCSLMSHSELGNFGEICT